MKYILLFTATLVFQSAFGQNKKILGAWDNDKGQILVFQKEGKALWIFYSESKRDTFAIKYRADFKANPGKLDLTDFQVGPLKGRTLYGIIEFVDKKTIRFDCEPGATEAVRPKEFNPAQVQTYKKK